MTKLSREKFMTKEELKTLKRVLDLCEKNPENLRDATIIRLLIHTGARASEILAIKKVDIGFKEKEVFIHGLKQGESRSFPLTPALTKSLKRLCESLNSGEQIFPITYTRLNQIWQEYKPCDKSMHSLRHAFSLRILEKTQNVRLVQVALGHASLTSTQVYMDFIYSAKDIRKALA